jgi:hypothetical protein
MEKPVSEGSSRSAARVASEIRPPAGSKVLSISHTIKRSIGSGILSGSEDSEMKIWQNADISASGVIVPRGADFRKGKMSKEKGRRNKNDGEKWFVFVGKNTPFFT